jgi:hypothetical protein
VDYYDRRRWSGVMAAVEQDLEVHQRGQEREQPKGNFLVDEEHCTSSVRLVVERRRRRISDAPRRKWVAEGIKVAGGQTL